jgi:hypothetical protein|tara:strand:+ start:929 stop:1216 length:288 start_codon:yes stop_codon:yes gene_type:complete
MGRYKNKWFRLSLEKDLKNQDLGVNVHCKEDGMHITIPPAYEPLSEEMMRVKEDLDTEKIVSRLKEFTKDYGVTVDLEKAIYGDNIKLKLKVKNV